MAQAFVHLLSHAAHSPKPYKFTFHRLRQRGKTSRVVTKGELGCAWDLEIYRIGDPMKDFKLGNETFLFAF